MNNVFVYCEIEGKTVADVSLELLTKGRKLANTLGVHLECICAGYNLGDIEKQVLPYGVDKVHVFDAEGLFPYTSNPHTALVVNLFKEEKPEFIIHLINKEKNKKKIEFSKFCNILYQKYNQLIANQEKKSAQQHH